MTRAELIAALESRIWANCMPEPNSGCWIWLGNGLGQSRTHPYGTISVGGRRFLVHRVMYEAKHGPIPAGMICRHKCDVTLCVNPDHLMAGTHADNMRDMAERHRAPATRHPEKFARCFVNSNEMMQREPYRRASGPRHGMWKKPQSGSENGNARLNDEVVRAIRSSDASQREIAQRFGVTQGVVWRIIHRRAWTHVE